jgi:MFS family permease
MPGTLAPSAAGDAPDWIPLILAATPFGAAIGFLVAGRLASTARYTGQLIHLSLFAGALMLGGLARHPLAWALVNVGVGIGFAWLIGPQVTFLRLAPARRMAQVTVTMGALVAGTQGAGGMLLGWVSDRTSVPMAYVAAGSIVLVAAVAGWLASLRRTADRDGGPLVPEVEA